MKEMAKKRRTIKKKSAKRKTAKKSRAKGHIPLAILKRRRDKLSKIIAARS